MVTFNGRGYDIPVLELAAYRFGLSLPAWFNVDARSYEQSRNRYNVETHIDLYDLFSNFGASQVTGGLSLLANLIGKPGKYGIDGSKVQDYHNEQRVEEINDYCRCDVLDTYFVFLRSRVLLGKLAAGGRARHRRGDQRVVETGSRDERRLPRLPRSLGRLASSGVSTCHFPAAGARCDPDRKQLAFLRISMSDSTLPTLLDEVRGKTLRLLAVVGERESLWSPPGLHNSIRWHAGHCYVVVEALCGQGGSKRNRLTLPVGLNYSVGKAVRSRQTLRIGRSCKRSLANYTDSMRGCCAFDVAIVAGAFDDSAGPGWRIGPSTDCARPARRSLSRRRNLAVAENAGAPAGVMPRGLDDASNQGQRRIVSVNRHPRRSVVEIGVLAHRSSRSTRSGNREA